MAAVQGWTQQNAQTRPNILFIMSDDHTKQAISAYGSNLIETPHIDRIAREGAIFKQSFVTNSICAPSRAVMLTGKHSHINGKIDNHSSFDWNQENVAKILQNAGYQTALIGKIHIGGTPQGFDYSIVLPGQGHYFNPEFIENGKRRVIEGHCSPVTTNLTLNWLENIRDKHKPFLLMYHQKAPHGPWMPELKYLDLLEDREFDFPDNFFDDYEGRGTAAREQEMEIINHLGWRRLKFERDPYTGEPTSFINDIKRMNEEQLERWRAYYNPKNEAYIQNKPTGKELAKFNFQRYLKDYLKTAKSVDDGIGEVMDYLEKNNLLDNTIIIYTSDQGFYLGEHGWFDKRFMYEESFSMPLVMRYPKEIKPGTEVHGLVQNLDFAPTFLDYAGVKIPRDMQGKSLRKLVSGAEIPWREAVYYHFYEYPSIHMVKRHYGIRTERYKLMHFYYDIDEWEMYDLQTDPMEMNSVYGDPEYAEVQADLHKKLKELRNYYGDSNELSERFLEKYLERRAIR
ncbi:MAG: sulfatase [Prolixibacteraceae bacterium]